MPDRRRALLPRVARRRGTTAVATTGIPCRRPGTTRGRRLGRLGGGLRGARAGLVASRRNLVGLGRERQGELERRALAELALDPDAPAVSLDNRLTDREAETRAPHLLLQIVVHPMELLEDPPELGLRDADALVGDLDARHRGLVARRPLADSADRDGAAGR